MNNKHLIYQFENFNFNEFIETYKKLCTRTEIVIEPDDFITEFTNISEEEQRKIIQLKPRKPLLSNDKIKWKAIYLIHTLIYRFSSNESGKASISSQILKSVIGKDYRYMLDSLIEMKYIEKIIFLGSPSFVSLKYSTYYQLCNGVKTHKEYTLNQTIIRYIEKTKSLINDYEKYINNQLSELYGETFKNNYLKSLNQIKIYNNVGLKEFIKDDIKENLSKKPNLPKYYDYILNNLKKGKFNIYNIDKSNRIYHIFTSLRSGLKQYLNIKFILDIKNSHPLLFSYFIFNYYSISIKSAFNIIEYILFFKSHLDNSPNIHYVGKYLYIALKHNNIENESVAKLKPDQIEYIYLTATGRLWDLFLSNHPDIDKNDLKKIMFAQVFYSSTQTLVWKEYGKEFNDKFPNVYNIIKQWKIPEKNECIKKYIENNNIVSDKQTSALPVAMMKLESSIFHDILVKLYNKRLTAFHIHDAIVIPNTKGNRKIDLDEINDIIKETYKSYGLIPTLSIDSYCNSN